MWKKFRSYPFLLRHWFYAIFVTGVVLGWAGSILGIVLSHYFR